MTAPLRPSLRLALFDCDGTLVDSQFAIIDAMTAAWAEHGLGVPDPMAVRRMVGLSLVEAVALLLPAEAPDLHVAVAESYKRAFAASRGRGEVHEPLFPGILDTLAALADAGVLLGVATGKSRRGLDAVLKGHGITGRFVTLQTADVGPGKPNPHMVQRALAETGAAEAGTVVIGDTTYDIQMARNARVASVGVSWGYHAVAELEAAGADRIVHGGAEVARAVLDLLER
ncbi:HAD-IA family hydrolase [Azospirillum doebereinerae]|uniref:HAD family hydrolase n=1 Tax=Azospirillum doebereinerae TaxID=92933 RepID=A0A3S1CH09_9PROT|nr:HAD-IA family hydrolase [Azospirillum doebereinerae]MCG5242885.1 HAD-IA family hydrolase [Azospirillum doebereinerae]RUQ70809.1 HAD family hydrolase [Azospirillum doebereinerae]